MANVTLAWTSAMMTASLAAGWLSDRPGRRDPLVCTRSPRRRDHDPGQASLQRRLLGSGLIGVAMGRYIAVDLAFVTELLPSRASDAGCDLGVLNVAGALPAIVLPAIVPELIATASYPGVFLAAGAFALAPCLTVTRALRAGVADAGRDARQQIQQGRSKSLPRCRSGLIRPKRIERLQGSARFAELAAQSPANVSPRRAAGSTADARFRAIGSRQSFARAVSRVRSASAAPASLHEVRVHLATGTTEVGRNCSRPKSPGAESARDRGPRLAATKADRLGDGQQRIRDVVGGIELPEPEGDRVERLVARALGRRRQSLQLAVERGLEVARRHQHSAA